jgi:hypothetical protein
MITGWGILSAAPLENIIVGGVGIVGFFVGKNLPGKLVLRGRIDKETVNKIVENAINELEKGVKGSEKTISTITKTIEEMVLDDKRGEIKDGLADKKWFESNDIYSKEDKKFIDRGTFNSLLELKKQEIEEDVNKKIKETLGLKTKLPDELQFKLDTDKLIEELNNEIVKTPNITPRLWARLLAQKLNEGVKRQIDKYIESEKLTAKMIEKLPGEYKGIMEMAKNIRSRAKEIIKNLDKEFEKILTEKRPGEMITAEEFNTMFLRSIWKTFRETEKSPFKKLVSGEIAKEIVEERAFEIFKDLVNDIANKIGMGLGEEIEVQRGIKIFGRRIFAPAWLANFLEKPGVKKWTPSIRGTVFGVIFGVAAAYATELAFDAAKWGWKQIVPKKSNDKSNDIIIKVDGEKGVNPHSTQPNINNAVQGEYQKPSEITDPAIKNRLDEIMNQPIEPIDMNDTKINKEMVRHKEYEGGYYYVLNIERLKLKEDGIHILSPSEVNEQDKGLVNNGAINASIEFTVGKGSQHSYLLSLTRPENVLVKDPQYKIENEETDRKFFTMISIDMDNKNFEVGYRNYEFYIKYTNNEIKYGDHIRLALAVDLSQVNSNPPKVYYKARVEKLENGEWTVLAERYVDVPERKATMIRDLLKQGRIYIEALRK